MKKYCLEADYIEIIMFFYVAMVCMYVAPAAPKVRPLMKEFVQDYETIKKDLSLIEKAAWTHAEFVKIHPFPDGNGRTSRLLLNEVLLENGYPPIAIKKGQVKEYYQALDTYGSQKDLKPFIKLIENTLEKELDRFNNHFKEYAREKKPLSLEQKSKDRFQDFNRGR